MANADTPMGFRPINYKPGAGTSKFYIAYNYGTAIYTGDAVILASGKVAVATAASDNILGVFQGCQYRDNSGNVVFSPYWPGVALSDSAAVVEAIVLVDRSVEYEVQCETGVAYVDATHVGTSCDLIATHAGSAYTGQSGMEITPGTSGDNQWLILGLVDRPDNAAGTNAKVRVKIHEGAVTGQRQTNLNA